MVGHLELVFPGLRGSGYQVTSPRADRYNCIAWAADDVSNWWWPDEPNQPDSSFWPPGVPRAHTLDAFCEAFATLGYAVCDDEQPEVGYEKVALFSVNGEPTHAARLLTSGRWTSKLGPMEDIEHGLPDLEGDVYGTVTVLLKRAVRK
jgi:hypothetical protein